MGQPDDDVPFLEAALRRRQVVEPEEGSPGVEPLPAMPDGDRDDPGVRQTRHTSPVGGAEHADLRAGASVRAPSGGGASTAPLSGDEAAAVTPDPASLGRDSAGSAPVALPPPAGASPAQEGSAPATDASRPRSHLDGAETTATEASEVAPASALTEFDVALVDEAMKKSALIWVRTEQRPGGRALWHSWLNGLAYVVTGGDEQPDPGLETGGAVVVVRSKDTEDRLLAFRCEASRMTGDDADWAEATSDLAKTRLNLRNAREAPQRWQDQNTYRVYRLRPTGDPLLEGPGRYPDLSGRARPVETTATTSGAAPWIVHRRGGSGRPLS